MSGYSKYTKKDRLRKRLTFQYNKKDFASAARIGEALLRAHVRENTINSPAYARDMYNVAVAASVAGHIRRAISLYKEFIRCAKMYPQMELLMASGLTNLAVLLSHREAIRLFSQALEIRKRLLPPIHEDLIASHFNLMRAQSNVIRLGIFYCFQQLPTP